MDEPKRPLTVAQTVASRIREQILKREISGGDPLRQEAIARSFGISIIPVREALRQLESEGLVELKTHRGAVATELTLEKALEWIHLRRLIETDLLGMALDRITEADLERAGKVLEKFNSALHRRLEIEHWTQFNWELHSALYAPAHRPETMKILESLHNKCDRYIRLQLLGADHIDRAQKEHGELIELCRRRRKREAKALLLRHIVGVEQDLVEQLGV
ncbi:MAG TPA: GntR family transcriptional regulator [Woeseiaceae bacterium]|jgi:DNA-binding GntR family transcriptional regulator|nr:GntR family transcriptional regulator [Woeseiaceae bacterium]